MTGLLASVASLGEVELALAWGADIIDLKDPAQGALGAWAADAVPKAVRIVNGRCAVSATVGDLPMRPAVLVDAARHTAATGVDIVKLGFFADGDHGTCVQALKAVAGNGVKLVAVLMADQQPDLSIVEDLAVGHFHGVMLDTADKKAGGLRRHLDEARLAAFVREAHRHRLLVGLAGSLTVADIAPLASLMPDYLGFRGALCRGDRTGALDPSSFSAVREALARTVKEGRRDAERGALAG